MNIRKHLSIAFNTATEIRGSTGNADYSLIRSWFGRCIHLLYVHRREHHSECLQAGFFCTNGMSLSKRDSPYANSGLVVTLPISEFGGDDPLAGMRLQAMYEQKAYALGRGEYRCPVQLGPNFLNGVVSPQVPAFSYPRGGVTADLREVLPPYIAKALLTGLPGMDRACAVDSYARPCWSVPNHAAVRRSAFSATTKAASRR